MIKISLAKRAIIRTSSRVEPGFEILDGVNECLLTFIEAFVEVNLGVFTAIFCMPISLVTLSIDKPDNLSFKWLRDFCALWEEHGVSSSFPDILGFKARLLPHDSLFSAFTASASRNLVFLMKLESDGKVYLLGLLDLRWIFMM